MVAVETRLPARLATAFDASNPCSGPVGSCDPPRRDLDGTEPRRVHSLPTAKAGRHGWADLLALVAAVRRLAFDRTLPPPEALGRIRDAYQDYDRQGGCAVTPSAPPTAAPGTLGPWVGTRSGRCRNVGTPDPWWVVRGNDPKERAGARVPG